MTEKKIIRKITVVSNAGVKVFEVGVNGLTDIKDESAEFPDAFHSMYAMYKSGVLVGEIIYCPVVVEFQTE